MEENQKIFREQSLEKLSSPDRLDQLLQVVRPHSWIGMMAVAIGIVLGIAWSIVGRIPARVSGTAILVHPKQVVPFQSPASGRIETLVVNVGDVVRAGDLMATLDLPALEKELEQERIRLEQFASRTSQMTGLERALAENERGYLKIQHDLIEKRIKEIKAGAARFKEKSDRFIDDQRKNVLTWRRLSEQLSQALRERQVARTNLAGEGLLSEDSLLDIRARTIDSELTLAELEVREGELELRANTALETYDAKMDLVSDLEIELHALELRELLIARRLSEDELDSAGGRQEIERGIEVLEARLEEESRVESEHDGRVLEIVAAIGQHVVIGERLGKIEIEDPSAQLMALAYFSIEDGKRIKSEKGSRIHVSPSTVARERHGALLGEVVAISDFPVTIDAAANQIGDREIARTLLGGHSRIEVLAQLEIVRDALDITSTALSCDAVTVDSRTGPFRRQRLHERIRNADGTVDLTAFADDAYVTIAGFSNSGNNLTAPVRKTWRVDSNTTILEVVNENAVDEAAGAPVDLASSVAYSWTSGRGPEDVDITAGTTASVRVTIEELAPITLILPFLRSTSGL